MLERVKTAVLVVLLAVLLLLAYRSFELMLPEAQQGGTEASGSEEALVTPAALPLKIALCTGSGTYMPLSDTERDELMLQLERITGEALGSAGERSALTYEQYLTLLRGPAVLLVYDAELPFSLLRAWAGYEYAGIDAVVRSYAVAEEEGKVILAFRDETTGAYTRLKTAADPDRLLRLCTADYPRNAVFGFEDERLASIAPDEPVPVQALSVPVLRVMPPAFVAAGELPRELLKGFSLNPYLSKVYQENDGTLVYVEDYSALRMTPSGALRYRVTTGRGIELLGIGEQSGNTNEVIAQAHELVTSLWSLSGASGTLSLRQITTEKNNALELSFCVVYRGVPVSDNSAAYLIVRDGAVSYLDLLPSVLTEQSVVEMLPADQLAAALPEAGRGARPAVRYIQTGADVLMPVYGVVK